MTMIFQIFCKSQNSENHIFQWVSDKIQSRSGAFINLQFLRKKLLRQIGPYLLSLVHNGAKLRDNELFGDSNHKQK